MPPKIIRDETFGKYQLRIAEMDNHFAGIVIHNGKMSERLTGLDPEELWNELKRKAGSEGEDYIGLDGAIAHFKRFFPDGFDDPQFSQERDYKLAAHDLAKENLPFDGDDIDADAGERALEVFRATNLLARFESMRVTDLLRGPEAKQFLSGCAAFTNGDVVGGIRIMRPALEKHECFKWTVATYLPFLWNPTDHMYLKPAVTQDFAARIGHPLAQEYDAQPSAELYALLLDLVAETRTAIGSLNPRDNIDIQSFIYVIGDYTPAEEQELAEKRSAGQDQSILARPDVIGRGAVG